MERRILIQESAYVTTPEIIKKRHEEYEILEFTATIQEAGALNRNKRIYPKDVLEKGIDSEYVQERLRTRSLFVEMGHPLDRDLQRQMTIVAENACALITDLWWEGNFLKAKIETLNTVKGRDFRGMILGNRSQVAFSLRAHGMTYRDPISGGEVVKAPIQICTWDYVVNPSHDSAWMDSLSEESLEVLAPRSLVLTEAVALFEEGIVTELGDEELPMVDYTDKQAYKGYKKAEDVYIQDGNDKIVDVSDNRETLIVSDGLVNKKVIAGDFIKKDIRNRIAGLTKEVNENDI